MTSLHNETTAPRDEQVAPVILTSRAELRDLLIGAGLARGAAEKVARGGWPALSGELTETDLIEEVAKVARDLADIFQG